MYFFLHEAASVEMEMKDYYSGVACTSVKSMDVTFLIHAPYSPATTQPSNI